MNDVVSNEIQQNYDLPNLSSGSPTQSKDLIDKLAQRTQSTSQPINKQEMIDSQFNNERQSSLSMVDQEQDQLQSGNQSLTNQFDSPMKTEQVRPMKIKLKLSDPLFQLSRAVPPIRNSSQQNSGGGGGGCPCCPSKTPNYLPQEQSEQVFCEFCGCQVCSPCLRKTRQFPIATNGDQFNIGNICKLCDKKFYIYINFMPKLNQLQSQEEIISKQQRKQKKLTKKLQVKDQECEDNKKSLSDVIQQSLLPQEKEINKLEEKHDKLRQQLENRQEQMHINENSLVHMSLDIQEILLMIEQQKKTFYNYKKQMSDNFYQLKQIKARSIGNSMISSDYKQSCQQSQSNGLSTNRQIRLSNQTDSSHNTMVMDMKSSVDTLDQGLNPKNPETLKEQYRRANETSNKNIDKLMQAQKNVYDQDQHFNASGQKNSQQQREIYLQRQRIAAMRQMEYEGQTTCCCIGDPQAPRKSSSQSSSTLKKQQNQAANDTCQIF